MRKSIWILQIAAILLVFAGMAEGQQINANALCLNGGSGYRYDYACWGYPNHGGGKYFPSFAHIPATSENNAGNVYPWKLAGWGWTGMMVAGGGSTWYWETCLQKSKDNPYSTSMSFDYPLLFCTGALPHAGACQPIYWALIPSGIPVVGGYLYQLPSSMGGWNSYLNIFAILGASFIVPSTQPATAYDFAVITDCASAITLPSSYSIWEFVYCMKGPYGQYLVFSCDGDCNQNWWAGNKARNYTVACDVDNGYFWYWQNGCTGRGEEWDMCLFLCDAVTIPVNIPGAYWGTPYVNYGFDVGVTCLTPYLSSGNLQIGFMTQDYTGQSGGRVILASFAGWPAIGPYGKKNYRVPHGWDVLTNFFLSIAGVFLHMPQAGYPSSMFGTTYGAHTIFLPFPYDPVLLCAEIVYSSFDIGNGAPSAGFMATYF